MKNSFYHLLFFLSIHLISYAQTNEQVQVFSLQDVKLLESPFYDAQQLPDKSNYYSLRYGPIVLGAELGSHDLKGLYAGDSRMGHVADGSMMSLEDTPPQFTG
jgi:hypothetical protein